MRRAMTTTTPMSVEEFLALPYPELGRQELIGGEVVVSDPDRHHQRVVIRLAAALVPWCDGAPDRGEPIINIDTRIGDDILQPDLQWYADPERFRGRPEPIGDLVVEVRSPSTWARDVGVKRQRYERGGVRELWLVDHLSRTVLVFRRTSQDAAEFDVAFDLGDEDALETPLLPGLAIPLASIFA